MNVSIYHSSSAGNLCQVDDLLIEAGVSIREIKKALGFQLSKVTACLVSHAHGDHSKGAKDLMAAGVDVYTGPQTAAGLGFSGHRLHVVTPLEQFRVGAWTVLPFPLVHDVENLGFLMVKGKDGADIAGIAFPWDRAPEV